MIGFALIVFISSFLLAAVAVLIASRIFEKQEQALSPVGEIDDDSPTILKTEELSSITPWDNLLAKFDFVAGMRTSITESGLSWTVGRLTSLMLLIGAFTLVILSNLRWTPFLLDLLLACGAGAMPYLYVLRRRSQRLEAFEKQFPDALDFLARSLRAGHPLPVCLELLAQEESPPLSTEMRTTAEERKLGMPLDQALNNLSKRVPLLNVRIFVAAVKLQSRTGGKLSDVLGGMAETMREAQSMEGEVQSLAAHGRVTGAVLTVLPLAIAVLMSMVNPGYLNILFENQTGRTMVTICAIALVAAHFVIRKIVKVKL